LRQVARDYPPETVAFTIRFGWFWHSVVRLNLGRQRVPWNIPSLCRSINFAFCELITHEDIFAMKGTFYENERVALFIDGANLYSAARALGFDIDYRRLLKAFREKGRMVRAYYYTALVEGRENSPIRPMIDWLEYNGFAMTTKSAREFTDAMGRRKMKGNMAIELAIDVLELAEHLDHVILFSGDGDFRRLVEAVQRKGLRVSVVSTIKSSPPMVADELRRQADDFIELSELASLIARKPSQRVARLAVPAGNASCDADDFSGDATTERLMRSA